MDLLLRAELELAQALAGVSVPKPSRNQRRMRPLATDPLDALAQVMFASPV